ncbi:MAG: DNA starvation/stationary phase protection protein Dps [Vampirovibrio sp.]|nr:DNA starvation/stationary phase protection protein Dps [Vampirovibrio sp.]
MSTAVLTKLHATRIDIPESNREKLVDLLNKALAATFDLKSQAKQAHWNVKGQDFFQLHELFDELATELEGFVDTLAERVTTLGGIAMGTVRMASAESILSEYPVNAVGGKDHLNALADRYAQLAKLLRSSIDAAEEQNDKDTADLFTEVSRAVDMRLWFLEAHLQG